MNCVIGMDDGIREDGPAMGYDTKFEGSVTVTPPLNPAEVSYLQDFNHTRRVNRTKGPYFVRGTGSHGQGDDPDIVDKNNPPEGQPGLWCGWRPSDDGATIGWDGIEKFYFARQWMQYLIEHFLAAPGYASGHADVDERLAEFTFDHVLNGVIHAQGEDPDDVWDLTLRDNHFV
jgi:hypothetical protein